MRPNPQDDPARFDTLPGTAPPITAPPTDPAANQSTTIDPITGSEMDPATDGHVRDGVEEQHRVVKDGTISVKARVVERQAAEVPAMRYVLSAGVVLAIIGMFIAWIFIR